jgi:hypothetical protein
MASVMLDTPSVIVSRMEVPFPSLSFSMLFYLPLCVSMSVPLSLGTGQWAWQHKLCKSRQFRRGFWNAPILRLVRQPSSTTPV